MARDVRMSANKKSAHDTGCVGTSTRASVRQKKARGWRFRPIGRAMSTAVAPNMNGGTRMAADVAVCPPLAHSAVLDAKHVAQKHTSTRARPNRSLEPAR